MVAVALLTAAASSAKCLRYEPAVVQLTGMVVLRTYPGPPNYESIKDGDAVERGWYLDLPRPICVEVSAPPGEIEQSESNVRSLQIVIFGSTRKIQTFVGREVRITGRLFHSHTGHHHTRVLIEVKELDGVRIGRAAK